MKKKTTLYIVLIYFKKDSFKKIKDKFTENELSKLDKDVLIEIFYLYEDLLKENLLETINKNLLLTNFDQIQYEYYDKKLNTIISKLENKKYIEKIISKDCSIYVYEDRIDLYLKKDFNLSSIINKILNYNTCEIIIINGNNKKSFENINEELLNSDNFIKAIKKKSLKKIQLYKK